MNLQIDTFAYTNRLRRLPPESKLLFAIVLLLITYFSTILVQCLIAAWIGIWIIIYAKIPASVYLRLLSVPIVFWLTSLPAFVISFTPLQDLVTITQDAAYGITVFSHFAYISHQGIDQSVRLLSQTIASTSCLYFVLLTVPFTDILQTLRRIGFPVLLTELLLLMYRFIFVLLQIAHELWTAQLCRGGYRTWKLSMNSLGLLIGQLLQRTLDHYHRISQSLESRGGAGEFRVWHSRQYHLPDRYRLESLFGCVTLIGLTGWAYVHGI
ncbi:cobalt ECF transporter T component CbiQ [filamentous cyanobacterium CCP2]|nr:cobalt ECF transporter T component CbiQ [filamentous cyanobacterium CCP2]